MALHNAEAATSGWMDTHCHLDAQEFEVDRSEVLTRAWAAGVGTVVIPGVDQASSRRAFHLAETSSDPTHKDHGWPGLAAAAGLHPLYVTGVSPEHLKNWLVPLLKRPDCLAVGEIGLDNFKTAIVTPPDGQQQIACFELQLRLACEFDLPVLLHVRHAVDHVMRCLRRWPVRGGIAHAFNGSLAQADMFLRRGFKLGIGGAVTDPRATRLRRLASELPLDSLVLETDAPDMAPVWLRETSRPWRNTPEQLPRIAECLAELRGLGMQELRWATSANACAVLPGLARGAVRHVESNGVGSG